MVFGESEKFFSVNWPFAHMKARRFPNQKPDMLQHVGRAKRKEVVPTQELKGYEVESGYMGWLDGIHDYRLFSTDLDYKEFVEASYETEPKSDEEE